VALALRYKRVKIIEMSSDAEEQAAIAALDGSEWMGRRLKVNKAKPREDRGGGGRGGDGGGYSRRY
jgi:RNA recognition motif-containing protein